MKNFLTLIIAVLAMSVSMQAQTVIWGGPDDINGNGSFDTGLDGWTAIPVSVSTGPNTVLANAVWTWAPEGSFADTGAFDSGLPIVSGSAGGAAGFNSDFLDNNGLQNNFGNGPAAGPQESHLLSPSIDLTGEDEVYLRFNSYYRGFNNTTRISVFSEGSAIPDTVIKLYFTGLPPDWEEFSLYTPTNIGTTARTNTELFDISSAVGGKSDVRLRFEWNGNYYFWLIDDVTLTTQPRNDLSIIDQFYPSVNGRSPECLIQYDPFGFNVDVVNLGTIPQTNVRGVVNVVEDIAGAADVIVYTDTMMFGDIAANGDTTRLIFDDLWDPNVGEGRYYLAYNVFSEDLQDFNTSDNATRRFGLYFAVENDALDKAEDDTPGFSVTYNNPGVTGFDGISRWSYANAYDIPDYDCVDGNGEQIVEYIVDSIRHGQVAEAGIANPTVRFGIHEVDTSRIGSNYDGLFGSLRGTSVSSLAFDSAAIFPIYFEQQVLDDGDFELHKYALQNMQEVELEAGKRYWFTVTYSGSGANPNTLNYGILNDHFIKDITGRFGGSLLYISSGGNGTWFTSGSAFYAGADLIVRTMPIATADQLLPENTFTLAPNLISTQDLGIQFDFEVPTTGHITVYDQGGHVLYLREHENLTNDMVSMPTGNMSSGTYFVLFQSAEGILTKKFVVSK